MKSRVILIVIFCLLGVLSLGAVWVLDSQAKRLEDKKRLLEQREELTAKIDVTARELSETEDELKTVQEGVLVYEEELSEIRENVAILQGVYRSDKALFELSIGGIPVNYDVENFRVKQRDSEQTGLLGNAFGSGFGTITQNTQQDYAAKGQQNRYEFYEKLTKFLEESYWDTVSAKAAFDGLYLYYGELADVENEAELFASRELLAEADGSLYESRKTEYLDALAKYTFDLNCVYLIYNNTLTENEMPFLNNLGDQVNDLKALFAVYDPAGSYTGAGTCAYGYTAEEKAARAMRIFGLYADAAKMQVNYLYVDGGMVADADLVAYRVGTIYGYTNRGDVVMFLEKDNPYDMSGWEYRFYDHEGKPLYLEEHQGKVLFLDGEVAVYQATTEYLQTQEVCDRLVSNAQRMLADYKNGILSSTYQNYAY